MRVELQGHRGARGLRPENTIPGFEHAIALGVDAIEFDVVLTGDDQLVVTHNLTADPHICSGEYAGRAIRELALDQLKTLDCGSRNGEDDFSGTHKDIPGTRMPTLTEALETIKTAPGVLANVELKSDPTQPELCGDPAEFTKKVVDEIRRMGMLRRSRLLSFDWRTLEAAKELVPRVPRYGNIEAKTLVPEWFGDLEFHGDMPALAKSAGAEAVAIARGMIDEEVVAQAAAAGVTLVAWTVNDPDEARRLIDLGVEAICTDYPDRIGPVIKEVTGRGRRGRSGSR